MMCVCVCLFVCLFLLNLQFILVDFFFSHFKKGQWGFLFVFQTFNFMLEHS